MTGRSWLPSQHTYALTLVLFPVHVAPWAFAETTAALDWLSWSGKVITSALNGLSQEDKLLVATTLVSYLVHWTQPSACSNLAAIFWLFFFVRPSLPPFCLDVYISCF